MTVPVVIAACAIAASNCAFTPPGSSRLRSAGSRSAIAELNSSPNSTATPTQRTLGTTLTTSTQSLAAVTGRAPRSRRRPKGSAPPPSSRRRGCRSAVITSIAETPRASRAVSSMRVHAAITSGSAGRMESVGSAIRVRSRAPHRSPRRHARRNAPDAASGSRRWRSTARSRWRSRSISFARPRSAPAGSAIGR